MNDAPHLQRARTLLKTQFGFEDFRLQQAQAITHVMQGQDCVVLMPTGGGKSLCYQIPALMLDGLTVVISPLIALMKDQVDALRGNGVAAEYLNSIQDPSEQQRVIAAFARVRSNYCTSLPNVCSTVPSDFLSF